MFRGEDTVKSPAGKNAVYITLCLAAFALIGCSRAAEESRLPVARVGRHTITQEEYKSALSRLIPPEYDGGGEDLKELKRDLINQLIEERLILDQARVMGITVSDGELEEQISAIENEYGDESFEEAIKEQYGSTARWKDEIRKRLIKRKVIENVVGSAEPPGEDAARRYYREHSKEYDVPLQVHARMIVVSSEEEALDIKKRLNVSNFAEVAREVSLSPDRDTGGDLGFFARGEMPKEFEDVVFTMKPGTISPVVKTPYGFHIFLVVEKKKGRRLRFRDVRESILQRLAEEASDAEFGNWVSSLKENVKIVVNEDLL